MLKKISFCGGLLAFIAVIAGVSNRLVVPQANNQIADPLNLAWFFNIDQALPLMIHNISIALSMLAIVAMVVAVWRDKQKRNSIIFASVMLCILLALPAILEVWGVLAAVPGLVKALHFVVGCLLVWQWFVIWLQLGPDTKRNPYSVTGVWASLQIPLILLVAISGHWVVINAAGSTCIDFPACIVPLLLDLQSADVVIIVINLMAGQAMAPESLAVLNALHHAMAGLLALGLIILAGLALLPSQTKQVRQAGLILLFALLFQAAVGIAAVVWGHPYWIVLTHTALSLLLALPVLAINFYCRYSRYTPASVIVAEPEQSLPQQEPAKELETGYLQLEPDSLYLRLKSQLKRTRSGFGNLLATIPIGQKAINADLLEEMEASLIMADVGMDATQDIIKRLTDKLERQQLQDVEALSEALKAELLGMLQPCDQPLVIPRQDTPFVILVVGINGAGKTTTIGKMAKRLQAQGFSVMLAAGDTFRAAAVEQLQVWGERNHIPVVAQHTGADSASVIYDAVQSATAKGIDVLIADTAGRLHTKSNLMDELKKVKRIIGKLDPMAPHEVLLVLDAGTGQNALSQAKLFNEAVQLTGLVLTKLDGTAKGGIIFALAKQLGIPIRYIGVGETIDDLQDFHAEQFVDALLVKDD